ncbi:hypothetical protein [Roseobacter sp. A03A-229]
MVGTLMFGLGSEPGAAQDYQIDCAILICLAGGWPASPPCARAKAEFIRRITPWPVEPPLQIWRCPMNAGFSTPQDSDRSPGLRDVHEYTAPNRLRSAHIHKTAGPDHTRIKTTAAWKKRALPGLLEHQAQTTPGADIDIRNDTFNFVRSIRVFHISDARQRKKGREHDCSRSIEMRIGTYGPNGGFRWHQGISLSQLPPTHTGLERFGQDCPAVFHRSVFVDWRDYEGNYGFEQVNY